jgi:thiosulfate reductase cytochrome b subunit
MIILIIFGVREGHRISTGKAVLAVLLPLIVVLGLGILAAILLPMFLGGLGLFRGVGV